VYGTYGKINSNFQQFIFYFLDYYYKKLFVLEIKSIQQIKDINKNINKLSFIGEF